MATSYAANYINITKRQPAPPRQLGDLRKRCKLPQRDPGGAPAANRFSRVLSVHSGLTGQFSVLELWKTTESAASMTLRHWRGQSKLPVTSTGNWNHSPYPASVHAITRIVRVKQESYVVPRAIQRTFLVSLCHKNAVPNSVIPTIRWLIRVRDRNYNPGDRSQRLVIFSLSRCIILENVTDNHPQILELSSQTDKQTDRQT